MIKIKNNENLIPKPPVVVVMGHIDHGKTSLLNCIRKLQFTGEKPGGAITQHIGAYQIAKDGPSSDSGQAKKITFIDTPGHEAFSAMRARGAKIADIAILVVDCCDGVKEQTQEALSQIRAAKIPFIIALNKTDKPEANPEKIKRELQKEEVIVEGLGGKVPSVEVSAKTGQGISELLELILLLAEMESLKSDILKPASGVVIESYLDDQRGPTATLILEDGTLKTDDVVGTFSTFGKIKNLEDFQGKKIETAFPSDPVIVLGLEKTPKVGESFKVFLDIESARNSLKISEKKEVPEVTNILPEQKVLNLILKADCLGSTEAIEEVLKRLPQGRVVLKILKSEVGEIGESDIKLAKAHSARGYSALILGFRVKIDPTAKNLSEREKIKIMNFEIIYDLVEGVRKFMDKILALETVRVDLEKVKILAIFLIEKNRQIVGGKIIEGEVKKGASIEVFRNEEKIGQGKMINLQRNKKDINAVSKGEECGILYEGEVKIEEGDILAIYTEEKKKGEL